MRLDNVFAASLDGFSPASTSTAPRHQPKPCRSTHQVWEATSDRSAISSNLAAIAEVGPLSFLICSGGLQRQGRLIGRIIREHRQTILAFLLASATAATLGCRRCLSFPSQRLRGS